MGVMHVHSSMQMFYVFLVSLLSLGPAPQCFSHPSTSTTNPNPNQYNVSFLIDFFLDLIFLDFLALTLLHSNLNCWKIWDNLQSPKVSFGFLSYTLRAYYSPEQKQKQIFMSGCLQT